MFGKKKCSRCGRKVERDFYYCPYCSLPLKKKDGLLDELDEYENFRFPFFDFRNIAREIDKQLRELDKPKFSGISISISSLEGRPQIKIRKIGKGVKIPIKEIKEIKEGERKEEKEVFARLPKEEASSKVRRLADKIVYEIELPGVSSLKNVFIKKLQNSIEIKAFTKDKAYFKLLPISLPLIKYYLENQKLFLELRPE